MTRFLTLLLAICLLAPFAAQGAEAAKKKRIWPGPYQATVARVVDADTIRVVASAWPGIDVPVSVRLAGIDTPESHRPKCAAERRAGKHATEVVRGMVAKGDAVRLRDVQGGKYAGRVVARLMLLTEQGEVDLGQLLITRGLARPYFGGKKADWCAILQAEEQEQ